MSLGILLVHGIGEQRRGDTLVNWLDTIVATITHGTLKQVTASVEWSQLGRVNSPGDSVAHAVVRIRGDGIDERWIVVEGWWADAFVAPSFSQLAGWSFRAVPWALAMHAAQRLHRSGEEPAVHHRLVKQIGGVVFGLAMLFLAPFIVLLLGVLALVGAIPSAQLRTAIGRFQRTLAATVGDSLVFLESPVRSAAMCSAVMAASAALGRLCDAAGCNKRVVLAHSQGATVSLEALTRLDAYDTPQAKQADPENAARARKLVFVTFGAGINKLAALRWLSTRSSLTDVRNEATVIDRDPVRAACVGLIAMAILGFWFWHLWGTGQLTARGLWAIPALYVGIGLSMGVALTLLQRLEKRFGNAHPWIEKFAVPVVVILLSAIAIAGFVVAKRSDAPVMPFSFALIAGLVLIGSLRLTLARDLQERIEETIQSPASVTDWQDFWATADPVPNGATRTPANDRPTGTRIWNEWSLLRDHTTYWQNRDGFVLPVVRILATAADSAWRDALAPAHVNTNARSRWRAAWLKGVRWLVPPAVALAVVQRGVELDAMRAGMGNALNAIGIGQWVGGLPLSLVTLSVRAGAALLCAWIAYAILRSFWHGWVSAEQTQLLEHTPPDGVTVGLRVFAAAAMLVVAGAFYVAKTSWLGFQSTWQGADLGEAMSLVFVVIAWSQVLVWLVAKAYPPPGASSIP